MSKNQVEDLDDEILAWENAPVFNITSEVVVESDPEPPYITDSDEMNENLSYSYLPELQPPKSVKPLQNVKPLQKFTEESHKIYP